MVNALTQKLNEIDQLIRNAQWISAQAALSQIKTKDIPTKSLGDVAALATRANLPRMTLKLLRPIVYPGKKLIRAATPREITEYAMALVRLGADSEASDLLERVSPTEVPISNLYKAILLMKQWKYKEAVPLLSDYLSKEKDPYFHTNGLSNLTHCLFFLRRYREMEPLLSEILKYSNEKGLFLQEAYVTRYSAMVEFQRKNWVSALSQLEKAKALLAETNDLDSLFVRKWTALTQAFQFGGDDRSRKLIEAIRNEAAARCHWETVRDIDYHKALLFKDEPLALKLHFGTPFQAFKDRLLSNFPDLPLHKTFLWELGPEGKRPRKIIDIRTQANENAVALKGGYALHRICSIFVSDFYRPFGVVTLFDKMLPGEHYNGEPSRHRIFQSINRLRAWFEANQLPLQLEEANGEYSLSSKQSIAISISNQTEKSHPSPFEYRLQTMQEGLGEEFSVPEIVTFLGLSRTRVTLLVEQAIESGVLQRIGTGKSTKYRFVSSYLKQAS